MYNLPTYHNSSVTAGHEYANYLCNASKYVKFITLHFPELTFVYVLKACSHVFIIPIYNHVKHVQLVVCLNAMHPLCGTRFPYKRKVEVEFIDINRNKFHNNSLEINLVCRDRIKVS